MIQPLPPSIEQLRKQANDLRRGVAAGDPQSLARVRALPDRAAFPAGARLAVADAQLVIARERGFSSWTRLRQHLAGLGNNALTAVIEAALRGDLPHVHTLLAADATLATANLYGACALGEPAAVVRHLSRDPSLVNAPGGPLRREPLLYACWSQFLSAPGPRASGIVAVARLLLDRGADPNPWFGARLDPNARQTALYGACGVNRHAGLTEVLLAGGADPNDGSPGVGGESLYHACEVPDLDCLRLLLGARPRPDNVSFALCRKLDFDDEAGIALLLDHGADPSFVAPVGDRWTALHHAVARRRSPHILELLLARGARVDIRDAKGRTPYALAMRRGDEVAATLLRAHGATDDELGEVDHLLGAAARGDTRAVRAAREQSPGAQALIGERDAAALTEAAGLGDAGAVRALLDLGFDPRWTNEHGATALHLAAWYGHRDVAGLLLTRGAPLRVRDRVYRATPIEWAFHGSEERGNPSGDYAGVVRELLQGGADFPERPRGSAAVRAVLIEPWP